MIWQRIIGVGLLALTFSPTFSQLPEDLRRKFGEAEKRIARFPPTAFPELPANVVRELQRRGCTIPQETYTKRQHNVIKREFTKPGQTDWTVLCSVNETSLLDSFWTAPHYVSTILVFWNGSEKNPATIAPMEDRNYLQGITQTEIGYSRGIRPVGKEFIMRHHQAYGGPTPPPIDHQGIDDAFIEKASMTWYFHGTKWLRLTGAD